MTKFIAVGIAEHNFREGGSSPRVVYDILHYPANVSMTFAVIESSELGRVLLMSESSSAL